MRKILFFVGIVFMTHAASAQTHEVVTAKNTTNLVELGEDFYKVTVKCNKNETLQTGYYKVIDKKLIRHGIWKSYNGKEIMSKAEFKDNNLVWIESNGVVYTSQEIEIKKLRSRVKYLESMSIADIN